MDSSEAGDEKLDERMPANQTIEDRKTQPVEGGETMAVKNRPLTLSCILELAEKCRQFFTGACRKDIGGRVCDE
jgi:hypothetical protein